MRRLDRFWHTLDAHQDWTLSEPQWRKCLGSEFDAIQHFLERSPRQANTFPCSSIEGDGCPMEIVYHTDGPVVARCGAEPERCRRMTLRTEDTFLYELNFQHLAEEVGRALSFTVSVEEMSVDHSWSLGFRVDPQAAIEPVYFFSTAGFDELDRATFELIGDVGAGFTLLIPTAAGLPAKNMQRLKRTGCQLLALDNLLFFNEEGRLERVPNSWGEKTPSALMPIAKDGEALFRRDKSIWRIEFGGELGTVPHLTGMVYLSEILRRPFTPIASTELVASRTEGKSVNLPGTEVADEEAIQKYRGELSYFAAEIEKARENNDPAQVSYLGRELEQVAAQLRRSTDRDGRPRLERDDRDKRRKSVLAAVNRAKSEIAAVAPLLGHHLDEYVDSGHNWFYRPLTIIEWRF